MQNRTDAAMSQYDQSWRHSHTQASKGAIQGLAGVASEVHSKCDFLNGQSGHHLPRQALYAEANTNRDYVPTNALTHAALLKSQATTSIIFTKARINPRERPLAFESYNIFSLSYRITPIQFIRMESSATSPEMTHVVCKADNQQHAVINIPPSVNRNPPPSSLYARPTLLGLTSNNLSYARGGDLLHWYADAGLHGFCGH